MLPRKSLLKKNEIMVNRNDFIAAIQEVKPAFGIAEEDFGNAVPNEFIEWSDDLKKIIQKGKQLIEQVRHSPRTPLVSILLEGPAGAGKSSLAAKLAKTSNYPFVKIISPDILVGYSEPGKAARITKIFDDAHKSPLSFIVIDDLERLIDYVRIGPRFSNQILQTLLVLIKKVPPKGRRLLIVATTSNKRVIEDTELLDVFDEQLSAPQINKADDFKEVLKSFGVISNPQLLDEVAKKFTPPMSVKRLIMLTEMAKQGTEVPETKIAEVLGAMLMDTPIALIQTKSY